MWSPRLAESEIEHSGRTDVAKVPTTRMTNLAHPTFTDRGSAPYRPSFVRGARGIL